MSIVNNRAKFIKLLSWLLGFSLLLSFSPLVDSQQVSANPDRLKWSVVDTPSEEGKVVVSPSEINVFVINQNETFYALDIPNGTVYKSTDAGVTWEDDITDALIRDGANLPAWDIAVAPDDSNLVAVVTDNRTAVYLSNDGGDSWVDSGVPDLGGTLISDIAISPEYDDTYDVAIGTRYPNNATDGDVWVITLGELSNWKAQELQIDPDTTSTGADVSTVRFSPNYAGDKSILAIASSANDISQRENGTFLCTGERNTESKNTTWTTFIEVIESSLGDSSDENEIIFSDLALPSEDYSTDWIAYASYYSNSTTECDDAYRIEEDGGQVYRLNVNGGDNVGIASIAYQDGILLAGEVLAKNDSPNALIHICSNPTECPPKWKDPTKQPTGGASSGRANAQVVWLTNSIAYCATSTNNVTNATAWANMALPDGPWQGQACDESALSKSEDGGDTWNQLSLIDTEMTFLCDYAFFANNTILYLASINTHAPAFDSIWRTEKTENEALTKTWQRVLCLDGRDNIILRPTPEWEEKEQIYFAVPGTLNVQYSENEGQTWEKVWDCPEVTDLAVVSDKLLYILDDDVLNRRSWNETLWEGIWEWQINIDTGLPSGDAVIAYGEHYVFVSEDGGKSRIAYSSDGGETFNLTEPLPRSGEIQLTTDEEFNSNKFIYAASDDSSSDIYRWTIGASTSWKEMNTPHKGFHGLSQIDEVLYGAYSYGPGVVRTLVPHLKTIEVTDWDTTNVGLTSGVTFKPRSLKAISNEDVDIWAIEGTDYDFSNEEGCLWVYTDAFVLETPWPNTPSLDESLPCDECTCRAEDFCFRWRMLPSTEKYELWIALDEDFTAIIHKEVDITPAAPCAPAWCPSSGSVEFICGETYFWKVRSCESTEGERIRSRWSPTMKFTVKECSASEGEVYLAPLLLVPEIGAKNIGRSPTFSWKGFPPTTEYEFILATDNALNQVVVNEKVSTTTYQYKGYLDWGTTYYWQVRAIDPVLSESSISTFTVMPAPEPAAPTPPTPSWIWITIGLLAFLDVAIIVFCFIKR
jgi:hypothetical protein